MMSDDVNCQLGDDYLLSSDDSIDEPLEQKDTDPTQPKSLNIYGQYGIGSLLMKKMGYKEGEGLGSSGQGIVEPIQGVSRPKHTGLGSTPALPLDYSDKSVSPDDSKERLLNQITQLQTLLKQVETADPSSLDVEAFCSQFRVLPNWYEDKIWEVLEISAFHQLQFQSLQQFLSNSTANKILALARTNLPESNYSALVRAVFLPALEKLEATTHDFYLILEQLHTFGSCLSPLTPQLVEILRQPVYLRMMLNDPQLLEDCVTTLPSIKQAWLDYASSQSINYQDQLTLCTFFNDGEVLHVFNCACLNGLTDQFAAGLRNWNLMLSKRGLLDLAYEKYLVPQWISALKSRLLNDELTPEWWTMWASYMGTNTSNYDQWALKGLNLINAYYDLGPARFEGRSAVSISDISLEDVLNYYCSKHGAVLKNTTSDRGTIVGAGKFLNWQIRENIVYIEEDSKLIPITSYNITTALSLPSRR